ncbi:MAG: LysM peptidoglycan-binding domain-containing protein [Bacillota bacterium]
MQGRVPARLVAALVGAATLFLVAGSAYATVHVVQPGDTLYLLAQRYRVTINQLASANSITDSHRLLVGTRLVIPGLSTTYTVRSGDTLFLIARAHGITLEALVAANRGVDPLSLKIGSVLTIPAGTTSNVAGAVATPWTQVDRIFPRNTTAQVTDVHTGLSFTVRRRGGWAHADVEPLTRADTDMLRRIYGGGWSWARRPVVVEVGGYRIAASMNGMPHGGASLTNNGFPGHHCIHFLGSLTHGTQVVDAGHQAAVREAVGR